MTLHVDLPEGVGTSSTVSSFSDAVGRLSLQEQRVDAPHDLGLLLVHHEVAVLAALVAEEAGEGNSHLAVGSPLSLSASSQTPVPATRSKSLKQQFLTRVSWKPNATVLLNRLKKSQS